jgi:hypothetical protein
MTSYSPAEEKRFLDEFNGLHMVDAMSLLQRQPITDAQASTPGLPSSIQVIYTAN